MPRVGEGGGGEREEDSGSGDGEDRVEGGGEREDVSDAAVISASFVGRGETAFEWVSLMDCVTRAPGVEQVNFLV